MIRAVHHAQISIPVGAEDAARAFYCGLLGLKEVEKPASLQGRGGFWVEIGEAQIHFGAENGVDRMRTRSHIAYLVTDLDGWADKLNGVGVEVKKGIPIPNFRRFEFRDPFGNRVEFLETSDQNAENAEQEAENAGVEAMNER